ncbi:MAG TPA: DUF4388 domain-containing protein [Candidatus Polarisedimenticolia bacterium]|nr:DUF4388 domain-containing protein [Candidatus Polarisedimenticolia bacterium]
MSDPRPIEIHSRTIPELLFDIHRQATSGRLLLRRMGIQKSLYLQGGSLVFAASTDRDDRLIRSLLRRSRVPLPQLLKGLDVALRTQRRLGEVLVERGQLTREDLIIAIREQVTDIVCGVFQWTDGTCEFEPGVAPGAENITLRSHGLEMIVEGMRRIESWARVQEVVGGLNTEYRATKEASSLADMARLFPGERGILRYCEEPRTLEEICDAIPLDDFLICKLLWGFLIIGALIRA